MYTCDVLRLLAANHSNGQAVRIFGLCDYNPYGCSIMLCYKYPSRDICSFEARGLTVPSLHWLGLRSQHVTEMEARLAFERGHSIVEFQNYSEADWIKVRTLLARIEAMKKVGQTDSPTSLPLGNLKMFDWLHQSSE